MYQPFYGLKKKPFQISSDPAFMWLGEKHKEALATLKYGIIDNKGFLLLTGDVGTGKTTLINTLIQSLDDDIICTSVPDPGLEKLDFFNYIGAAFGIDREFSSKGSFLAHFRQFLLQAYDKGKKVLLIIDEAQLLTQELLEEIRLLSNIEKAETKLINIFFIGQNEFNEILNRDQNRAVRQRLTLNYNIDPLTPEETGSYIEHRLRMAGADPGSNIFDNTAKYEVFLYSGGFPRRINVICDHCLLSGYVKEQKKINAAIVKECATDLKIPEYVRNRDINGYFDSRPKPAQPVQPAPEPVAASQPVQQPALNPAKAQTFENESKTGGLGILGGVLLIFIFIGFAWFFMFPDHFSQSISKVRDRFIQSTPYIDSPTPDIDRDRSKVLNDEDLAAQDPQKIIKNKENEIQDPDQIIQQGESVSVKINPANLLKPIKNKPPDIGSVNTESDKEARLDPGTITPEKGQPIMIVPEIHQSDTDDPIPPPQTLKFDDTEERADVTESGDHSVLKETAPVKPLPKENIVVRFKYNTNDFTEDGFQKLMDFTDILSGHPNARILISGYTDSEGYKNYNIKLSEFRANIIRSFFLGRGIHPDRIEVKGRGSENPVQDNATAWGRMMNRRVEIEVIP